MFTPFAFVKSAAPTFVGLLDTYPGARAAYSVRRLSGTYNGSAIKVRRGNDNATQDIGFTAAGNLDTGLLATFVGANNGFVETWYDQSGNGSNLTQTANDRQPEIVNTGTLETVDGISALRYNNSDFMDNSGINTSPTMTLFHVAKAFDLTGEKILSDSTGSTTQAIMYTDAGTLNIARGNNQATSLSFGTTLNRYISAIFIASGNNSNAWSNTTQIMTNQNVGSNAYNGLRLGAARGLPPSAFWLGWMQEFILYPDDQSTNRANIVTNITDYY
jgi:hypothetical protein